ncbi:gliding motility-associated C-terminal domain-containing protein [Elusimicrobiota bacterium]
MKTAFIKRAPVFYFLIVVSLVLYTSDILYSNQDVVCSPSKICTPNGDGWNDYFKVTFANPYDSKVKGKIYDIYGALVADMENKGLISSANVSLVWDGKCSDGSIAADGVYIYQIEISGIENKIINGTVVIAR